ncbi:zinc finger protein 862-like [Saccostrea cucullata]|uniref:zinc finger protein 862-like n=1 Tax=Saccostrea cuccullata TaxID=36930 RepID=UPI002ED1B30F
MYERSVQKMAGKKFFSILIDGATDSSVTENELVYVRFVNNGVPENHYLSIEDIQNADAKGILNCIDQSFERAELENWKTYLVGFGSDGASVNLGSKGGVAALLKNDVPHLVIVHCIAHRLELAANNAIKSQKIMKDIQDILTNTYKQYHYSPKALRELRIIADALEEKVLKPTNLHGTRWLPHVQKALAVLLKNFTVIITHFDHIRGGRIGNAEVQGRATNISKKLKDYQFLYMSFFLLDVLKTLSVLSLKVQRDSTTLSQFLEAITVLHFSLIELKQTNGEELSKFIGEVNGDVYHNITLQNVNPQESYRAKREEVINVLIDAIDKRFAPMEKDPILKAAATLLDLTEYPKTREGLALFAIEELNLLMQHFGGILQNAECDVAVVGDEFKAFKAHVYGHNTTPIENYFQAADLSQRFQNYLMLVEILLVFPISSAACERGFSCMKRVKSDWRSSLTPSMLRMLMFISIEGCPLEEFNSTRVLDKWWNAGRAKRPGFNPFDFRGPDESDSE